MLVGTDVEDYKRKRALLLHYAGEEVSKIFETFTETGMDYACAKKKLSDYFSPNKNTEYELYKFRQAKQEESETVDTFHTRLRQLSINGDFATDDKEIKSQIIQGYHSSRLRRRALREEMKLDTLLSSDRALELSDKQATDIDKNETSEAANVFRRRPRVQRQDKTPGKRHFNFNQKSKSCRNCGS